MIEKIMRAVKSNNKKRGRNITIGAVVGMLLSCSAVMGADTGKYLWIKGDGGIIKFNTLPTTKEDGADGEWKKENPYDDENSWTGSIYINNITLTGTDNGKGLIDVSERTIGYGLRLSGDLEGVEFINNGIIIGTGTGTRDGYGYGYGIYNSGNIKSLKNIGIIIGTGVGTGVGYGTGYGDGYGIYNSGNIKSLKNIGTIIGTGVGYGTGYGDGTGDGDGTGYGDGTGDGDGIYNSGNIKSLKNIGTIIGTGAGAGCGIYNSGDIKSLKNIGIITGTDIGSFGSDTSTIGNITNTGVIYGGTNAIKNNGGTITKANNYGLLVSGRNSLMYGTVDFTDKYGLAFTVGSDKYILDGDYSGEFGKIYRNIDVIMGYKEKTAGSGELDFDNPITKKYTIINAKAETKESSTDVIGTESLVLADGKLTNYNYSAGEAKEEIIDSNKRYILNGITNTLEVTGRHNELNNSVINAYTTAVVMDKDMTALTLNNTVVNGNILGSDGISTINIEGTGNTLTINGDSVINTKDKTIAITVGGNNNAVTLEGNAIINGDMKSTGKNTLNLNGTAKDGMNMLHNIDGFTDISIDNNVTFFEDMKVTGTKEVTVEKTGVLSLRLKKEETKK